jgi:hypothetical protein
MRSLICQTFVKDIFRDYRKNSQKWHCLTCSLILRYVWDNFVRFKGKINYLIEDTILVWSSGVIISHTNQHKWSSIENDEKYICICFFSLFSSYSLSPTISRQSFLLLLRFRFYLEAANILYDILLWSHNHIVINISQRKGNEIEKRLSSFSSLPVVVA